MNKDLSQYYIGPNGVLKINMNSFHYSVLGFCEAPNSQMFNEPTWIKTDDILPVVTNNSEFYNPWRGVKLFTR